MDDSAFGDGAFGDGAFESSLFEADDQAPAELPAESLRDASAFVTETMGELLVAQGFTARAVDVYTELVRRRPYDPVLSARLAELQAILAAAAPLPTDVPTDVPSVSSDDEAEGVRMLFADAPVDAASDRNAPALNYGALDAPTTAHQTPWDLAGVRSVLATPAAGLSAFSSPSSLTPVMPVAAIPAVEWESAVRETPVLVTPYSQPALTEPHSPHRSAREWFATLAARRVARRTPPQSSAPIVPSPEGLASLFGTDASTSDDAAARAFADAFAPVPPADADLGASFDFAFSRATPAASSAIATDTVPAETPGSAPARPGAPGSGGAAIIPSAPTPSAGNAGFSFEKFFPDATGGPATGAVAPSSATPTAPSPVADAPVAEAPVTDDLAQFSAWLKGLSNP